MDRRHFRIGLTVAAALVAVVMFSASAEAQLLRGNGCRLLGQLGGACQDCGEDECICTPYLLNLRRGQHGCCGCGCQQSGYGNWCGHGKNLGWTLRSGGLLPSCPRARAWKRYYHGGHAGCGGGCGCGPGCGGSGSDLFYNYYAPQTGGGGATTQMYASPQDTPHPAVQTYFTYQPWMPHEFMYQHNRSYVNYHSGPYGMTMTNVSWGDSPIVRHTD